jgi:hypothetical protein
MRLAPPTAILIALFCLLGAPFKSPAYTIQDPNPALTWDDMQKCPLVVEAVFEKSDDKTLTLKVARVFKGDAAKVGDLVSVSLEGWYSVQFGISDSDLPPSSSTTTPVIINKKIETHPQLCRKSHYSKSGFAPVPLLDDLRKPAVYFFPSKDKLSGRATTIPHFAVD